MSDFLEYDSDNTLEPPGSIAILGGGPLGIETALYARYLGFSVRLFSADSLVSQLLRHPEAAAPGLFATPLGLASLAAQRGLGGTTVELDCPNHEAWAEHYFRPLLEVDFLKGAASIQVDLVRISFAQADFDRGVASDQQPEDDSGDDFSDDPEDVPPDFLIEWTDGQDQANGVSGDRVSGDRVSGDRGALHSQRFEAIIDARASQVQRSPANGTSSWFPAEIKWLGPGSEVQVAAPDYYLLLNELPEGALTDADMFAGFQRIQKLFASLCDRPKLDVYGNLGGFAGS